MVELLIALLILVLVAGVVYWAISVLPIPEPFRTIALVVTGVIFLLIIILKVIAPLLRTVA